jgi:CHAD domain-containing protein
MAKARKIPYLEPEKDLKSCLSKILRTRFEEMIAFEGGALEVLDIEELHDMRVASRRVQAVMKVFRAAFPRNEFEKQYKIIRELKDALGEVRHYDVFIEHLTAAPLSKGEGNHHDAAVQLLIIRQKALREGKRRELARYIRGLNRKGYKEGFLEFAGK